MTNRTGEDYHSDMVTQAFVSISQNCRRMVELNDSMMTRILESNFKNHLLPVLRDWVLGIPNPLTAQWIDLACGPDRPMLVLDDTTKEVLFIVPPLYADIPMREAPTTETGRQITPQEMYLRHDTYASNGETRKAVELDMQIVSLFSPEGLSDEKNKHLISLLNIWVRYKLDPKEILGEHTNEILALIVGAGNDKQLPAASQADNEEDDEPLRF